MIDHERSPDEDPVAGERERTVRADAGLVVVCDPEGSLLEWSQGVRDVTGLADDTIAAGGLGRLIADGADVRVAVERAARTGSATVECRLADTDAPVEFRFGRWTTDEGDERVVGVGESTTRERAGPEPDGVLDRMADAFFAMDETWEITYVNDQAREVLTSAMAADEDATLVGRNHWKAIPEAVDTPFHDAYQQAMETQEPVTLEEYYGPLDSWFEVRAYPSQSGLSVYFRDVTERRQREEELESRKRVLQTLYEATADRDRSFSEKVETLLWIGTEALGVEYGTLSRIDGDEYVFEVVEAPGDDPAAGDRVPLSVTACERVVTAEERMVFEHIERDAPDLAERTGNEEPGIACYLGAPVIVEDEVYGTFCFYDGEPRATFTEWEQTLVDLMSQWVGQELTRQRVRERLQRQNEQLEQFASIVSHDLRNPLNVVLSGLQLAEANEDLSELERCYDGVERMEKLIDNLLALARAGDQITDVESLSLASVSRLAWEGVETSDATLELETEERLLADESRLRQVLENLFRNAVEHGSTSPASRAQQDAVEHGSAPTTVTVGDHPDGFYVADDGPGIDPSDGDRVFETGFTTDDDGTGLGLAIVEQVATAHDWTVDIDPDADGAKFVFSGVERPSENSL